MLVAAETLRTACEQGMIRTMNRGRWKKGESGNPSGRPAVVAEIRDLARAATAAMFDVLVSIAKDRKASPSARVAAASVILDRAWGRPAQDMNLNGGAGVTLLQLVNASLALGDQRSVTAPMDGNGTSKLIEGAPERLIEAGTKAS
jgi:hypothetical protein